ncbi:multi drug resistance-associated protein MRP [Phycomyces nitens]|nr:multi drug resistance-associated protein MRP [Phycomyces nitens]
MAGQQKAFLPDQTSFPFQGLCQHTEGWGPFSSQQMDFTPCFLDMVVVIPSVFLLIAAMVRIPILLRRFPLAHDTLHWVYFIKLTLLIILLFVTSTSLFLQSAQTQWNLMSVAALSLATNVFVVMLAMTLHHLEYTRNRTTSGTLVFYWILVLVGNTIKLRSLARSLYTIPEDYPGQFSLYFIRSTLSFFILLFEATSSPRRLSWSKDNGAEETECPEATTSMFGRLGFSWISPLMAWGSDQLLLIDDLWFLGYDIRPSTISTNFKHAWDKEKTKKRPSLYHVLFPLLGGSFYFAGLLKAVHDILQFMQPILLKQLMDWVASYTTDTPASSYNGAFLAAGMFMSALGQSLLYNQFLQLCHTNDMKLSAALITSISTKTLELSTPNSQLSMDVHSIKGVCALLHGLWSGIFQLAIGLLLLYATLGLSFCAGVLVLVLVIPLYAMLNILMRNHKKMQDQNKQGRMQLVGELLNSIRAIKINGWEDVFFEKINQVRNTTELPAIRKYSVLRMFRCFAFDATPFCASVASFALYTRISTSPLTSQIAFVSILLFNILFSLLSIFPTNIDSGWTTIKALKKIRIFLASEERDPDALQKQDFRLMPEWTRDTPLIDISKGSFKWTKSGPTVLSDIDLQVRKGDLIGITGCQGAGKSTLLSALLGNLFKCSGNAIIRGSIAYVSPEPWISQTTLRDAIVFGHRWDKLFYQLVLSVCQLQNDLADLPKGDNTLVMGDSFILTPSQQCRVALARALYARADIYLLDDPLKNVDIITRTTIMANVFGPQGLLKNKARLFVTDAITDLQRLDRILLLENGKIEMDAGFGAWMNRRSGLHTISRNSFFSNSPTTHKRRSRQKSVESIETTRSLRRASMATSLFENNHPRHTRSPKVVDESAKALKDDIDSKVIGNYMKSCSLFAIIAIFFFLIFGQGVQVLSNLWLKYWLDSDIELNLDSYNSPWIYLELYAGLGAVSILAYTLHTIILWGYCAYGSAKKTHYSMLQAIIRSPIEFFNAPYKTILSRFDNDQYAIDQLLPESLEVFFRVLVSIVATTITITLSTPFFLVLVIPLSLIFVNVQSTYRPISQRLNILCEKYKSDLTSRFKEMHSGIETICGFNQQRRFLVQNEELLDDYQNVYHLAFSCKRWMSVRIEVLGSVAIFGAAILAVIGVLYGTSSYRDPGLVGLGLLYALSATPLLQKMAISLSDVETHLISVSHVQECIEQVPEKYEAVRRVHPMWPIEGSIEFCNYSANYQEGICYDMHDLSFKVEAGSHIGVIDRSVSRTTPLSLCLLRMIEKTHGSILVDGIDISTIRLSDIRSRLAIIPCNPTLFPGTLREHLDQLGIYEDVQIWRALQIVGIDSMVKDLEGQLSSVISEENMPFSIAQGQLIYLARAILRRATIIVWEESNEVLYIENESIHDLIQQEFKNCTVITVGHSVSLVMASDRYDCLANKNIISIFIYRILVFDQGTIIENNTPQALLSEKTSVLYTMAVEANLCD